MHPDLAKSSGAISILTSESFLLGGVGRKGQWPESSLSSCQNSQSSLGSPCQDHIISLRTFQGLTLVHRPLSMVGTSPMSTFWALRYTINILTSVLHQFHPSGMGDTTQVIVVPSASPQNRLGENHTSSLTSTKQHQKRRGAASQHSLARHWKYRISYRGEAFFKLKPDPGPITWWRQGWYILLFPIQILFPSFQTLRL